MKTAARINAIKTASFLDSSITDISTFQLSEVELPEPLEFDLPANLRLGHLAERIVAELIRASSNYTLLHENIQITEGNDTIGELDYILQSVKTGEITHVEFAYKFYLYDPSISADPINNWIGPNRNDSLSEKLKKLRTKQFPLLHHPQTARMLNDLDVGSVSQALCLLASLYLPYAFNAKISPSYKQAVRGYYLNFETFAGLDNPEKSYYLPSKKEWGIHPSAHEEWTDLNGIRGRVLTSLAEKRAVLCWQNLQGSCIEFFITWY